MMKFPWHFGDVDVTMVDPHLSRIQVVVNIDCPVSMLSDEEKPKMLEKAKKTIRYLTDEGLITGHWSVAIGVKESEGKKS